MWGRNKIAPVPPGGQVSISEFTDDDWRRTGNADGMNTVGSGSGDATIRRRRRHVDASTNEYASYVEKRMFNKLHAWTPYLGQRKQDKHLAPNRNPTKGWAGFKHRQKMHWNSVGLAWREWKAGLELWRGLLKRVEGRQGTGVISYFLLLKFLLFLNLFIFLATFGCIVVFDQFFKPLGYTSNTIGTRDPLTDEYIVNSSVCAGQYVVNKTSGFQLALDFIQGTGWMTKTALFYGHYGNQEVDFPGHSYNIPLAYLLTTVLVLITSLVVIVHKITSETEGLESATGSSDGAFFRSVFSRWDFRVCGEKPTKLQHRNFYHQMCGQLEEFRHQQRKSSRTGCGRCCLVFVRILINILIIGLLGAAAAAIYYAQKYSSDVTTSTAVNTYDQVRILAIQFLPSLVIAAINSVYPVIFGLAAILERYSPDVVIKITVLRIVFVRLAALIVVTATIYVNITCSQQDMCRVGVGECPAIQCWETYFGQQIYKFMVTEIAIDILMTFIHELPRKLLTTKCDCGLLKKIGPAEFDVAMCVLNLVYAQTLCWLGFFFVPLLTAMLVLRLLMLFYLKTFSALYTTVPPEKPYQASRSNAFFMVTLLVTFFLIAVPMGYVFVALRPSPMCGPFRVYAAPVDIVGVQISLAHGHVKNFYDVISSSAFIIILLLILLLAIYYLWKMKSANYDVIKQLQRQLLQGEKDKQFLLLKLSNISGSPQKPALGINKSRPEPATNTPRVVQAAPSSVANNNFNNNNNTAPPSYSEHDGVIHNDVIHTNKERGLLAITSHPEVRADANVVIRNNDAEAAMEIGDDW
ncbi:transmembrane channel-like protein 7 [Dreissena polymorpha]|uniref:TMC domain-containing protein n=1 Tax=Dreissena polymorpha TaxID=45954 RepID=A0A9D4CZ76_DREPO|nr:transmembrane channel-like protein 7 [Dreissena polymorpha]KAH3734916.1 hypothetical protein DPMN_041367 [Dreissena polymorpha]